MSNWSGVLTNPNSVGFSIGLNSPLSLNDTTANWPNLTNYLVRIIAGLGVGQERQIQSNTATTIIITAVWLTIPDITSQYEIVLVLRDNDHIVGNLSLSTGLITELEDSANIYLDGNYTILFLNTVQCRWNKSKTTLVTFQPNQIEVQGKAAFWGYIYFQSSITNAIKFSYIYLIDSNYGVIIAGSAGTGNFSEIHHIRTRNLALSFFYRGNYSADTQNVKISNLLHEGAHSSCKLYFNRNSNTIYEEEFERLWIENCNTGGIDFASSLSAKKQIVRDAIFKESYSDSETNIRGDADKRIFLIDSYFSSRNEDALLAKGSNVDTLGITFLSRNFSTTSKEINNTYAHSMSIYSKFNDFYAKQNETKYNYAFNILAATDITSDNDYIAGRLQADPKNIDISESTTSTENPQQYIGLTSARTNAKSTLNKLLECDNIQTNDLLAHSVDISFDCKNSHAGTTVDQDSNVGQKILYIADTSDFEEKEIIEIGFGTVRAEEGEIDSINTGISITLKENLSFAHSAVNADFVKKQLRHFGLPFVKYGKISNQYDNETPIPEPDKWGAIFCNFETNFFGREYEWKKWGHSITLENLDADTTYYVKVFCYNPLGDLLEGTEINFTTQAVADYTDPGISNVRDGITYKFAGGDKEGVLDIPIINDVRDEIFYDNLTKEGILDLPLEIDVRLGTIYDNGTKTGELQAGISQADIDKITDAVWDELSADHADENSFGGMIHRNTGLVKENLRIYDTNYVNKLLTEGKIRIYPSSADMDLDTNAIATYQINASFHPTQGTCIEYKVKKI